MQREPGGCRATCAEKRCFQRALPGWVRVPSLWGECCCVPRRLVLDVSREPRVRPCQACTVGGSAGTLGPQRVPSAGGWAGSWGLQGRGPGHVGRVPAQPRGHRAQREGFPSEADPPQRIASPPAGRAWGPRGVPAALLRRVRPGSLALGGARCPLRWAQQVPSGQQGCPWVAAAVLGFSRFPSTFSQGMWAARRLGRTLC